MKFGAEKRFRRNTNTFTFGLMVINNIPLELRMRNKGIHHKHNYSVLWNVFIFNNYKDGDRAKIHYCVRQI